MSARAGHGAPMRVLLGAFGDPGHAFPMIALGRALAARGHEVTLQTWRRWREHVEAEGIALRAGARVPGLPHRPRAAGLLRGGRPRRPATRCPLVRELAPDVVVADILTLAPALAAELAGVPCATLIPHVYPHGEPGLPDLLARRAPAAHGRRPRLLAPRAGPVRARPASAGDASSTRRARGSACPRSTTSTAASAAELALVATFPQLEYPRAWPAARARRRPADVGAAAPTTCELPAGRRRRSCSSRPRRRRTPSTGCCTPRCAGSPTLPVRVLATWNRRLPPRPLPVPENAQRRRLGLLLAHDAALRRRRLPRRPRHARARALLRAARSSPARPSAT